MQKLADISAFEALGGSNVTSSGMSVFNTTDTDTNMNPVFNMARLTGEGDIDWRDYNPDQAREIRDGLKAGVDVRWYIDTDFDNGQMEQIREGLEAGVDVSKYADPNRWARLSRG